MAKFALLAAGLLATAVAALAQKSSVIPLVPAANWRLVNSRNLPLEAARDCGSDPAVENEYGVKALEERTYRLDNFSARVIIEQAQDPSAGYGLYTYYRTAPMVPEKGIDFAVRGPGESLMLRGPSFVRVQWKKDPALSDNDFRALLILVGGTRPSRNALAGLPPALPAEGMVPGSEKYLIGMEVAHRVLPTFRADLIGFAQGAEAQVAAYSIADKQATALAINYPTPQIARVRFGALESFLGVNRERGHDSVFGKRQGSYVFLILNAETPSLADQVLRRFTVQQQVSWDQRYPGDKPFGLQLFEMIIANIIIIMVVAGSGVFGGIAIVLSRRVVARLFPDWSWGHPEEERLIRLNLR